MGNRQLRRLDVALVEGGFCNSRQKAQRAIMAGLVTINGQLARKPGDAIRADDQISITEGERYVGRGGFKLEHALNHFGLKIRGLTALDVGASTGGFTDCLLQGGVSKVYAVDVGRGQLAWKLRNDPRVVVMEKTNARDLKPERFPQPFFLVDLIVIDCSFISLRKIMSPVVALLRPSGNIVALIKPQFEAGKAEADKGAGIITDPTIHERVLREIEAFVGMLPNMRWLGVTESPLLGPAGNKEFLALIEKAG